MVVHTAGQLASTYLDAYLATGEADFADAARGVLDYLRRDMTAPQGGFYRRARVELCAAACWRLQSACDLFLLCRPHSCVLRCVALFFPKTAAPPRSAEDADSVNEKGESTEGAFYLWSLDEIERVLVRVPPAARLCAFAWLDDESMRFLRLSVVHPELGSALFRAGSD